MTKRLFTFALALLLLLLPACSRTENELLVPPESDPPAQTEPEPAPPPAEDPLQEDPPAEEDPPLPSYWVIDTAHLDEHNQTIEQIWPVTDDRLLVFTSTLSGGYSSELIHLHVYDLETRAFTGDHISLGIVGQYPQEHYDDGTAMVLLRNTETYAFETMLFIDPYSLTFEEYSLSGLDDLRSIHISPDKTHVALSTMTGLRITDLTFVPTHARYDAFVPEEGDPDLDLCLPAATGWLDDGQTVTGKLMGWEWIYYPFTLTADGTLTMLEDHPDLSASPYGNSILLQDYFTLTPAGILSSDGTFAPLALEALPDDSGTSYISAFSVNGQNELIAVAVATPEGDPSCRADLYWKDRRIEQLHLSHAGTFPQTFDTISFTPDGGSAVLMTGATVDNPCTVHILNLE